MDWQCADAWSGKAKRRHKTRRNERKSSAEEKERMKVRKKEGKKKLQEMNEKMPGNSFVRPGGRLLTRFLSRCESTQPQLQQEQCAVRTMGTNPKIEARGGTKTAADVSLVRSASLWSSFELLFAPLLHCCGGDAHPVWHGCLCSLEDVMHSLPSLPRCGSRRVPESIVFSKIKRSRDHHRRITVAGCLLAPSSGRETLWRRTSTPSAGAGTT